MKLTPPAENRNFYPHFTVGSMRRSLDVYAATGEPIAHLFDPEMYVPPPSPPLLLLYPSPLLSFFPLARLTEKTPVVRSGRDKTASRPYQLSRPLILRSSTMLLEEMGRGSATSGRRPSRRQRRSEQKLCALGLSSF